MEEMNEVNNEEQVNEETPTPITEEELQQRKEKTEKYSAFINELRNEYSRLRSSLKTDIPDDELLKDETFKKCFKITYIMTTALSSQDGLQSLFILADNYDFNMENLLSSFEVVKNEENQYPIIVEKDDNTKS